MTPSQVLNALGQHLLTMTDCPPVIWPNRVRDPNTGEPIIPEKPYLVVQRVNGGSSDPSLKGGAATVRTGKFVVVVVHDLNAYSTQADTLAAQIADHFNATRRPAVGITITDVPDIAGGYPTDTDWRVPVQITWKTTR